MVSDARTGQRNVINTSIVTISDATNGNDMCTAGLSGLGISWPKPKSEGVIGVPLGIRRLD